MLIPMHDNQGENFTEDGVYRECTRYESGTEVKIQCVPKK